MPQPTDILVELLPHELAVLQKFSAMPEIRDQLEALPPEVEIAAVTLTHINLDWLVSDLNYAIVKLNCDDQDAFNLSDRLEFILATGKGELKAWY